MRTPGFLLKNTFLGIDATKQEELVAKGRQA
jgi:hypothetical protein